MLRRLDCVLEATKPAVLTEKKLREKAGLNPDSFLLKKSGQLFFNTSPLDLKKLMGDQDHIGETAGEHFTPREIIRLMVNLIFIEDDAAIGALDAHTLMSTQALNSETVRGGIKDILINHAQLWEALRSKGSTGRAGVTEP